LLDEKDNNYTIPQFGNSFIKRSRTRS